MGASEKANTFFFWNELSERMLSQCAHIKTGANPTGATLQSLIFLCALLLDGKANQHKTQECDISERSSVTAGRKLTSVWFALFLHFYSFVYTAIELFYYVLGCLMLLFIDSGLVGGNIAVIYPCLPFLSLSISLYLSIWRCMCRSGLCKLSVIAWLCHSNVTVLLQRCQSLSFRPCMCLSVNIQ